MQVKKLSTNNSDVITNRYEITHNQLQNEFHYYRAKKMLIKLLENNLITKEEFNKINELNRQKYKPLLGPLMCENP